MTGSETSSGYEWLKSIDVELVTAAMELEAKNDERYPQYLMNDETLLSIDPRTFWTIVEKRSDFKPSVCQFACRLMKLPASASGLERCFSTMGSILNRNRNNLQVDKASKLCTIYRSLRCLRDEDFGNENV